MSGTYCAWTLDPPFILHADVFCLCFVTYLHTCQCPAHQLPTHPLRVVGQSIHTKHINSPILYHYITVCTFLLVCLLFYNWDTFVFLWTQSAHNFFGHAPSCRWLWEDQFSASSSAEQMMHKCKPSKTTWQYQNVMHKPTSALLQLKGLNAPFPFNGIWIAMEQRPWILLVSWVTNEAPQTYHRGRTVPKGQGAIGANMVWYRLGHVQYVLVCLGQLHVGMSIPSMFFEDKSWWPTPVDTQTCSRTKSTNLAKPLARNLLHYRIYFSTHEASDKKHCLHQTPFSPKCLCNGTLLDWKPFKPNCLCTRKTLSLEPLFR